MQEKNPHRSAHDEQPAARPETLYSCRRDPMAPVKKTERNAIENPQDLDSTARLSSLENEYDGGDIELGAVRSTIAFTQHAILGNDFRQVRTHTKKGLDEPHISVQVHRERRGPLLADGTHVYQDANENSLLGRRHSAPILVSQADDSRNDISPNEMKRERSRRFSEPAVAHRHGETKRTEFISSFRNLLRWVWRTPVKPSVLYATMEQPQPGPPGGPGPPSESLSGRARLGSVVDTSTNTFDVLLVILINFIVAPPE